MIKDRDKPQWCSSVCKLFHRDMGWREMEKQLDTASEPERLNLEKKILAEKLSISKSKKRNMNPFYRDDVMDAMKQQKEGREKN